MKDKNRKILILIAVFLCTSSRGFSADQVDMGDAAIEKYLDKLERKIKLQWFPPKVRPLKTAIVRFQVQSDGLVSKVMLEKATKNRLIDQAALKAVKNASRAEKLPSGFPQTLELEFTFDNEALILNPSSRHGKNLKLLDK